MMRSAGIGADDSSGGAVSGTADLVALDAPEFSLELTLSCGQVFHWMREGEGWLGAIGDRAVYVEQRGERLFLPADVVELARHYFALDHPLEEIYATFPKDEAMQNALGFCRGLRLIRQPLWECVATFITSSMKQVSHIAQISHTIRQRFGDAHEWEGRTVYGYPTPERMAALTEADLLACSLGYRAKNLLNSARMIAAGEVSLEHVQRLPDEQALAELCRLPGVGEKVANCALLFAFERQRAFPIDVWIERVLRQIYFQGKRKVTGRRLREFSASYFGAYSGYAQQYLFHYARATWPRGERTAPAKAKGTAKRSARKKVSSRAPVGKIQSA